jgi:hypothetical protein
VWGNLALIGLTGSNIVWGDANVEK